MLLGSAGLSACTNFNKGQDAYDGRGDHATALREALATARRGDWATARSIWEPLAERGVAAAQYRLGFLYSIGKAGLPQDSKRGLQLIRRAAEQGHTMARGELAIRYFLVGSQYENGMDLYLTAPPRRDIIYSYMWISIAEKYFDGYPLAGAALNILKEEMTPSQIKEAEKRVKECIRKQYEDC